VLSDTAVNERDNDIALVVDTAVKLLTACFSGGDALTVSGESYLIPFRSDDYTVLTISDTEASVAVAEDVISFAVADKLAYYLSLRVIVSNIVRYIEVEAGYRSGKYDDDNKKQRSNEARMLIQESAPYLSSPDFLAAR
jgi:hypothetical protein